MYYCWCNFLFGCIIFGIFDLLFLFFKQKTAYEMRISDWSSDVCSSDLYAAVRVGDRGQPVADLVDERVVEGVDTGENVQRVQYGGRLEIGRASCRGKSVSVRVDTGGRRIIKKKTFNNTRLTVNTKQHNIKPDIISNI